MATRKSRRKRARKAPAETRQAASPATPFDDLTRDQIEELLKLGLPDNFDCTKKFVDGDHWQEGSGWVGPAPDQGDSDYSTTLGLIQRAFTSRNVTRELITRHMRGVVGEEPTFGIAPRVPLNPGEKLNDEQQKERLRIEQALTDWWDSRGAHVIIQNAVMNACYASRGTLRLYVPRGKLNGGVIPKMADLSTALELIYLDAPEPDDATVFVHDDTKERIGILKTQIDKKDVYELVYLGPDTVAPGQPADPKNPRETIIRTIDEEEDTEFPIAFGGQMTMFSIERPSIITPQQNQLQRALNLCLSMVAKNVVSNGFLQRMILNALPPGHWRTDSRGRKVEFIPENFEIGPGTTNWLRGLELPQKDGSTQLTDPAVHESQPVNPTSSVEAERSIYQDMLEEADQAHILMTSQATPSGVARVEGRSDFEVSLSQTKAPTNHMGRWLVESLLAMADAFMQTPGKMLAEWRGQFQCRINTGPVPIAEREQIVAEYEANLISAETAQAGIGIVDVQAEADRITAENGGVNFSLLNKQADLLVKLGSAGASIDGAAELVGITAADAKKLLGADTPPADPSTDPNAKPIPGDVGNTQDPAAPPKPAKQPRPQSGANAPVVQ